MATRKKAKTKIKRRKAPAKRPAARRKTVKRARKPARKAPVRRAAPKAVKRRAARPKARMPRPASTPAPAPERAAPGERVGVVTHFYGEPSVAIVKLDAGTLRIGDTIHFRGHTTDFSQRVDSLQVEHAAVDEVGPDDDFGVRVDQHVREHDVVYKVTG